MGMTVKELYEKIKECIDEDDMSWDTQITFANASGSCYEDVNGAGVECNGYEFRLWE